MTSTRQTMRGQTRRMEGGDGQWTRRQAWVGFVRTGTIGLRFPGRGQGGLAEETDTSSWGPWPDGSSTDHQPRCRRTERRRGWVRGQGAPGSPAVHWEQLLGQVVGRGPHRDRAGVSGRGGDSPEARLCHARARAAVRTWGRGSRNRDKGPGQAGLPGRVQIRLPAPFSFLSWVATLRTAFRIMTMESNRGLEAGSRAERSAARHQEFRAQVSSKGGLLPCAGLAPQPSRPSGPQPKLELAKNSQPGAFGK